MYLQVYGFPFTKLPTRIHTSDRIKYLGRVKYYVTSAPMFIDMATLAH